MSLESRSVSGEGLGSLQSCLVEGDPEQRLGERRVRRRALMISIAMQGIVVAALVLVPLFGRPARIALANVMPLPPYYHSNSQRTTTSEIRQPRPRHDVCRVCPTMPLGPTIPTHDPPTEVDDVPSVPIPDGPEMPGGIRMPDPRDGLRPPPPRQPGAGTSHVVHSTHIDPALLIHRVEPAYPILAKQLGRFGRVELHAIIAADGTIQSLQVVSGDPMFYQSALDAVRQWRYTPTVLNGQVMEVDTYITVIYNIAR